MDFPPPKDVVEHALLREARQRAAEYAVAQQTNRALEEMVERPPLRIRYIMLWTALTAVLLAIHRAEPGSSFDVSAAPGLGIFITLLCSLHAAAVAGFFVLLPQLRYRGGRWLQPGEWLVTATALRVITTTLILGGGKGIALMFGLGPWADVIQLSYPFALFAGLVMLGGTFGLATLRLKGLQTEPHWPWFFRMVCWPIISLGVAILFVLVSGIITSVESIFWIEGILWIFGILAMLWAPVATVAFFFVAPFYFCLAVANDWRRRRRERSWLHWTGVAIQAGLVITVTSAVVFDILTS